MKNITTTTTPLISAGPGLIDMKGSVGKGLLYESISQLISSIPNSLQEGMLVIDTDFSVTWQLYYDTEWKYRLYDGTFYVDAVSTSNITLSGEQTVDDVALVDGNICMPVNQSDAKTNGIYYVREGPWERHAIFDETSDDIVGIYFKVKDGTEFKNSLWMFASSGDIEFGTSQIIFQKVPIGSIVRDIRANVSYALSRAGGGTNPTHTWVHRIRSIDDIIYVDASLLDYGFTASRHAVAMEFAVSVVIGKEYRFVKTDDTDNPVLINAGGLYQHSFGSIGMLTKKGDWLSVIVTEILLNNLPSKWITFKGNSYDYGCGYVGNYSEYINGELFSSLIRENLYATKKDVFINSVIAASGVAGSYTDSNVYYPIDVYDDVAYAGYVNVGLGKKVNYYDYDGNLLASIGSATGNYAFFDLWKNKYVTKGNEAATNGMINIKIPAGWKLKTIYVDTIAEIIPVQATGQINVVGGQTNGDTLTIGDEVFTVVTTRSAPFEITNDSTAPTFRDNIRTAINADSTYVTASGDFYVDLTALGTYPGIVGNDIVFLIDFSDFAQITGSGTLTGGEGHINNNVIFNIGTTSEGTDIINNETKTDGVNLQLEINKVLSLTEDTTLYISSANWDYCKFKVYATRDEGVSYLLADIRILGRDIIYAQVLHDGATEGTDPGEYIVGSKAILQAAIDAAELVYDDGCNQSQSTVDEAIFDLDYAVTSFKAEIVEE